MTPIHLTNAAVAQAALFAHHQGRLCAQNPSRGVFYGETDNPGLGCAIGVALPQHVAEALQNWTIRHGYEIYTLLAENALSLTADDPDALRELQELHDDWSKDESSGYDTTRSEAKFLRFAMELAQ